MKKEYILISILVLAVSGYIYLNSYNEPENITPPRFDNIDDILEACTEAMGGSEVIEGIQTLSLTMNWPDHGTLHTEMRRPNMERLGESLVWNGTYCVLLNSPDPVPEEEWKDNEVDIAWYFPAFFEYSADYLGYEAVDGTVCYMVEVTLPLGAVMTYYLDSETDLVLKATADIVLYGESHHFERTYRDYQAVDGFLYPHKFTYAARDGVSRLTATVQSLELNLPLEGRFSIP